MRFASINEAYRDGHGDTDEEHICPDTDGHETFVITKLMVESVRDCTPQPERESHTRRSDTERYSPIPDEKAQIHLESYQEEEKDQPDVGRGVECRHGGCGEDGIGKAWGTAEDGGTEKDAANDLCDDPWLSDLGKRKVEESGEYDDDAGLQERRVSPVLVQGTLERHTWMMKTKMGFLGS